MFMLAINTFFALVAEDNNQDLASVAKAASFFCSMKEKENLVNGLVETERKKKTRK